MKLYKWLMYGGFDKKTFEIYKEELTTYNRKCLAVFSSFVVFCCVIMTIISFLTPTIVAMRHAYMLFLVVSLLILGLVVSKWKNSSELINALVYVFIIMLFAFGIVISTIMSPTEVSATYIAVLIITPQLFTDKPYRVGVVTLLMNVMFILMLFKFKEQSTWSSDTINAIIFFLLSMLLLMFNTNSRISQYEMERKIRDMAEKDQLTGLLNRNSFQLALSRVESMERKSFYAVYLDVNGLHELNNTEGHEAGDKMLIYIAKAMQEIFGECFTYRIGGDEYVSLGYNLPEDEIVRSIGILNERILSAGYHVAIGYKCEPGEGVNIQHMIKAAETLMYADKKAYYEAEGKNPNRIH